MNKAEVELLCSKKISYAENSMDWVEFNIKGIPYRISTCGILQTRLGSRNQYCQNFVEWKDKKLTRGRTDNHGGYYLRTSIGSMGIRVHRLVAIVFLGEIAKGFEVNHIDGNRDNNSIKNIEIVSHKENMEHMARSLMARFPNRRARFSGKIKESDVPKIEKMISDGMMNKDICKLFSVDPSTISRIRTGRFRERYWIKTI